MQDCVDSWRLVCTSTYIELPKIYLRTAEQLRLYLGDCCADEVTLNPLTRECVNSFPAALLTELSLLTNRYCECFP